MLGNTRPVPRAVSGLTSLLATLLALALVSAGLALAAPAAHSEEPASTTPAEILAGAPQPDFAIVPPDPSLTVYGSSPIHFETVGKLSTDSVIWSVPAGNPVGYMTPAGTFVIRAAGTVVVTAVAGGDGSYDPATTSYELTIDPRAVTVRVTDTGMVFGDTIPDFEWTPDPALFGADQLAGSLKLDGDIRIGDNAIVEDEPFSNPNYRVTFEAGSLIVVANDAQREVMNTIAGLHRPVASYADADQVVAASAMYDDLDDAARAALPDVVWDVLLGAMVEAGDVNHRDPVSGITATGYYLPWQVRLIVSEVSQQERDDFAQALAADRKVIAVHGIHFADLASGAEWQPATGTAVSIDIPGLPLEGYQDIQVQHQTASGALETIAATVTASTVRFDGTSFSLYGVTGVHSVSPENGGTHLVNTGSSGATPMLVSGLVALLLGAGVLLLAQRTRGGIGR